MSARQTLVVAVSGGVDSMVLLHQLVQQREHELVVAHFDHGIRPESWADRWFVQAQAHIYSVPFEYSEGALGVTASEAAARQARYEFLWSVCRKYGATLVMAHHQDDMMETALINLLRGTNRRGLSSLSETYNLRRPLLNWKKSDIISYALQHYLEWREDETNASDQYLRNRVRRYMLPKLGLAGRQQLQHFIETAQSQNAAIDGLLEGLLAGKGNQLERDWFADLPEPVAIEVMAAWLRAYQLRSYDSLGLRRLVTGVRSLSTGKKLDVYGGAQIFITKQHLKLVISSLGKQ